VLRAERISQSPIVWPDMDDRMGDNIATPCLIVMPEWATERLGKYHLYFSDHKGRYLRLAYSDNVTGPWQIHTPGVMDVEDSLFVDQNLTPGPHLVPSSDIYAHIGSPHVCVDNDNHVFHLYYHGLLAGGSQSTRYASSTNGLDFSPQPPLLGPPYFKVAPYKDKLVAVAFGGQLLIADNWAGPFKPQGHLPVGPTGDQAYWRHADINIIDDTVHFLFSRIGDSPERIQYATLDLTTDPQHWQASGLIEIMRPQDQWEGADLPVTPSVIGFAPTQLHQLRDPTFFTDTASNTDGNTYLVYVGGGESGIGLARINGL
jgi:hypothetical protein